MLKKILFSGLFLMSSFSMIAQPVNINGAMNSIFASPVIEEGKRNIILQNRCGNRLTLLVFDDKTSLEFIYKPNAFRRKEYRARNFSNRDNFTLLFPEASLPMISNGNIASYEYDPFVTRLKIQNQHGARNEITVVNVADENMFALSASAPTVLTFKPHRQFAVTSSLLYEKFVDRGEEIVSFVAFRNMEQNRFRVLKDGTYVLQLFENDVIFIGGEENEYQMHRAIHRFDEKSPEEIIAENERRLAPQMNQGRIYYRNPDFQRVLDINHRVVYSGIDEGGACFGALNRIYYLIWVRDGSMTASLMARAGNPGLIKCWAPFLLNNPNVVRRQDGTTAKEFLQIAGTRWTRNEDDGIYYAVMSLYTYFKTTGQDDLFSGDPLPVLIEAVQNYLSKNWDSNRKMVISSTIGETPLRDDPYFGYDVVNGNYEHNDYHLSQGKELRRSATLYLQVNTYNIMMMMTELLSCRSDLDKGLSAQYLRIARELQETLRKVYYDKANDCLYSAIEFYADGTEGTLNFKTDNNPWEGSWACSVGPFFPVPDLQLKTARVIYSTWPKITKQGYGYCPWNTLGGMLYEYGLGSSRYEEMLSLEIKEANMLTRKYPMPGALTEYSTNPEGWRGLPFSAGSLFFSMSGHIIQSLPSGIAVRASEKVDSIKNFRYKLSSLSAFARGNGDEVETFRLNGEKIPYSLQLPESKLLPGPNVIEIERTRSFPGFRLYSSSATLHEISLAKDTVIYSFSSAVPVQLYVQNIEKAGSVRIEETPGRIIPFEPVCMPGTGITLIETNAGGKIKMKVVLP